MTLSENEQQEALGLAGAEARAWLVRLHSGAATLDDVRRFQDWRGADRVNERAYRAMLAIWNAVPAALADPQAPHRAPSRAAGLTRRQWMAGAAAAAVAGVVSTTLLLPSAPAGATVIETAKGERKRARFADGVAIELNTDTRLWSLVRDARRVVQMDRGEAVISTEGRALLARCGDSEVVAQDARFVLRAVPDGSAAVLCLAGSIALSVAGDAPLRITAGREAVQGAVAPIVDDPSNDPLAWRRGVLVFRNRPAREVVAELNRYRPGRIVLPDSHGGIAISGVIHVDRADPAVDHLARSMGLRVTRLPGGIALLGS